MSDESSGVAGPDRAEAPAVADPIPVAARAANLKLWNAWSRIHEHAPGYNTAGFLSGETSLTPVELEELSPFVHEGTTLLHLQCHFGLDTLSWARLGADVVGLDFSDEAVALARRVAGQAGLSARAEFICSDLYDANAQLGDRLFDVVFVNWGAIEWLPDLELWAAIVARHLKPGGTFYLAEIHPFAQTLDDDAAEGELRPLYVVHSLGGAGAVQVECQRVHAAGPVQAGHDFVLEEAPRLGGDAPAGHRPGGDDRHPFHC